MHLLKEENTEANDSQDKPSSSYKVIAQLFEFKTYAIECLKQATDEVYQTFISDKSKVNIKERQYQELLKQALDLQILVREETSEMDERDEQCRRELAANSREIELESKITPYKINHEEVSETVEVQQANTRHEEIQMLSHEYVKLISAYPEFPQEAIPTKQAISTFIIEMEEHHEQVKQSNEAFITQAYNYLAFEKQSKLEYFAIKENSPMLKSL